MVLVVATIAPSWLIDPPTSVTAPSLETSNPSRLVADKATTRHRGGSDETAAKHLQRGLDADHT